MLPKINNIFWLTKDPEIVNTANGKTLCRMSLACNEKYGDREEKLYINGVAFGNGATAISNYFHKGSKIFISGKIAPNNYEKDGKTVYGYQVIVESFEFVDKKQSGSKDRHNQQKSDGYQPQGDEYQDSIPF